MIDCASRSPPPSRPPSTVRCAIARFTVWSLNGPVRLASTSRIIWSYAPTFSAGVWVITWAARTAYRWDRKGRAATTASSPVDRARNRYTPPCSADRGLPINRMPT